MDLDERFDRFQGTDGYIASEGLRHAVNVALALERPLLVRGEPGTGKTLLAHHVADALSMELLRWHVKSTTKAQDGLYVYDTVARLHDSRFGDGDVRDIRRYIKLGPLGRALSAPSRVVLLIDEVDKADVEFPNDLLQELDVMRFQIPETGDEIVALIDWIAALRKSGVDLRRIGGGIPFLGTLLKNEQDLEAVRAKA
jgi:MoxR-like ATPase